MKLSNSIYGDSKNPAVVLIHPFPFDHRLWGPVAMNLADAGFYVITPDLRGCGLTELGNDEPDLDLLAADVAELITDLNLVKPIIGGISLGGYVALALARTNSDLISGLILLDTKASADNEAARENRMRVADQMKEHGKVGLFVDQMLVNVVGPYTHENRENVVSKVKDWMLTSSAETIAWLQIAMANRLASFDVLGTFKRPVLLIRGSEDAISTAQDFQDMQSALEKNQGQDPEDLVTFIEILNAGHLPPVEDSLQTAKVIGDWLAKVTSANR